MKKILLVGGTGFVGTHLRNLFEVDSAVISTGTNVDIRDIKKIRALIERERPDNVVHLAAITTLRESFKNPENTYDINFMGTLNVLKALRDIDFSGRFLFISSSEVYGLLTESDLPVTERQPTKPLSPYAVSKIAAEALCYQWSQLEKFETLIARPFNHIGPGQSERFAISDFGKQIAAIKLGLAEPVIHVGDIDTTRDFTDVRDIVAAYQLLLRRGRNGEIYNVCSGREYSIRTLLMRMCFLAGVEVELRSDVDRFRSSEQRRVLGSNNKLHDDTGWNATYEIDQTLKNITDYWVRKLND